MIHLGDDIGMQSTMLMKPALWREWLKPRLAKVIAAARAVKPDVLIWYHSCGYVRPVIGELAEIGIDVLNPVQPECMDFAEIHPEYGDRIGFWGTLGTQTTMPFGTPAEVRAMVFRNLKIAGPKGGLFCTPTHLLEPEVPWENILAYVQACRDFTR
jgi:uroporphyrinogen decarboxylase